MLTLAVTSSTAAVGAAVVDGSGSVVAFEQITTDRRHAEELVPLIDDVLGRSGLAPDAIDRLAVDIGPGRFTGLRIGVATVRTLAFALDRLVVGVSSLEALAAGQHSRPVAAVIDARRGEVFQQRFDETGPIDVAAYGRPEEMAAAIGPDDIVVGDGADRYRSVYGPRVVEGAAPRADVVGQLSVGRTAVPGREILPLYLRDPDVQINIRTRPVSAGGQ